MQLHRPLATVTPTLDGDVLALLSRVDEGMTSGQVRRLLPQFSEEGVRKVLKRLHVQGVLQADRVGNAVSYRLNREHLAADHIIGLAHMQEAFLDRLRAYLDNWVIPPVFAAMFGSAARATMRLDSDVDLLLVRPTVTHDDEWAAQVERLVIDASRWIGNDVRPVEFSTDEIESRAEEQLIAAVLAEGLTVLGDRSWLADQLRQKPGL